jgi:hypothetical protein
MTIPEIVTITIVVGGAVFFMIRRAVGTSKGEKGSCKSCGDTCGCAIKDQINQSRR